ncbi:MAG: putative lipase [Nocardioidaceae bacterium]|nr:putative lipase [Nocardioidaceae bacterium]
MTRVVRLLVLALVAVGITLAPAGATAPPPGPALTVPEAQLAAAVSCDATARSGNARQVVLLIPGTGATAEEAWAWNYERSLPAAGFGTCTVQLPERSLGDFTVSAQYAVYAARHAYQLSGKPIAILGHSQGGLMAVWIAKFWPDVAAHASDVIGLAADVRGTQLANTLCTAGSCAPIAWQMARGSHLTNAATNAPLPSGPAFTSIGSLTDEVVFPQPTVSSFPGVRATMVQDVCPVRVVDHGLLLADAVGYQLVLDALTHAGPAVAARVPRTTCLAVTMPGVDPLGATQFAQTVVALSLGLGDVPGYTTAETPLPAYAQPYGG